MIKARMYFAALAAVAVFTLGGCASTTPNPGQTPQQQQASALADAQNTVANLTRAYTGVVSLMVVYKRMPVCGSAGATQLCSKPDVVAQLQQADTVAYNALVAAQNVVRVPGAGANVNTAMAAAQQAISALSAIAATLPTQ